VTIILFIPVMVAEITLTANTTVAVDSYQWFLNGDTIMVPLATLIVSAAGDYNVVVTSGGCSSSIVIRLRSY